MDTFYIITNYQKDPDLETAQAIQQYLEKKGKICYIQSNEAGDNGGAYKYTDASRVPDDVECVLVIGGDGTLLQAARDLVERQLPLLGINMGTLGYLAEIDRKSICPALEKLITGEYSIEHRMMLCGSACHQNDRKVNPSEEIISCAGSGYQLFLCCRNKLLHRCNLCLRYEAGCLGIIKCHFVPHNHISLTVLYITAGHFLHLPYLNRYLL